MANENIFPVYNPDGSVNIDGFYDADGAALALTLTISPTALEPNDLATARVTATQGGAPLAGALVVIISDTPASVPAPAYVITDSTGQAVFGLVGVATGVVLILASMNVNGVSVSATPVEIAVAVQQPPANWDATGYGQIAFKIEPSIANALYPRVERLSHHEQISKYPDDDCLKYLTHFSTAELVFMPTSLRE